MKKLFLFSALTFGLLVSGVCQNANSEDYHKTIIDNDKVTVTEFVSSPGKDVCGAGLHHHDEHLTIALADANLTITSSDEKSQTMSVKEGDAFWFNPETHKAINSGDKQAKFLLVYVKDKKSYVGGN